MSKIDSEKLAELRKAHRVVTAIEVEDNGETLCCYLKRPSVETQTIVNKLAKTDDMKALSVMISNCWLEGDSVIKDDPILLAAVGNQFGQANQPAAKVIKN
ncbi:MAG: hypothetical protein LBU90_10440 [Bacteroidales bacterium]|jgi:hypothetical protein|nr:hypothetical protein [Bacteroidales bacterium]